jgi:hypothetical protein
VTDTTEAPLGTPAHLTPGDTCPDTPHTACGHPEGATLYLGGTAWAHPKTDTALAPLTSVHPYPGNPRRGDQDTITTSITDLGFYGTITAQATTGHILVGNHRHRALTDLDAVLAPIDLLAVSDTVASALVVRDNYTSDQAENDRAALVALLTQLEDAEALTLAGGLADDLAELRALEAGQAAGTVVAGPGLADRFLVPPFSVLDARSGLWQARKREWLRLGIKSEVGRGGGEVGLGATPDEGAGWAKNAAAYGRESKPYEQMAHTDTAGVSIFDPVLCELAYRWFTRAGAHVLDPFAGGSVRGIVATALQRHYTGIELRPEQVAANGEQAQQIIPSLAAQHGVGHPVWIEGDSRNLPALVDHQPGQPDAYDLLFSCPPYYDLEVYSTDPADLSAMEWQPFLTAYQQIITAAVDRLAPDRFAVWVVGEVRDPRGVYRNLVGHTVEAFETAGARYYNEAIMVTPAGSLPLRAGKQFAAGRKLGKTHQQVLVFCKGDPKRATAYAGDVEVAWPEGWDATE